MSCFTPPKFPIPSLPGLPGIKFPDPNIPKEPSLPGLGTIFPSIGIPDIFLNWHPNLCDLLILFYLLFLLIDDPDNAGSHNPTLDEARTFVDQLTSGSDYFASSNEKEVFISPPQLSMEIVTFRPRVYPMDFDTLLESIYYNYDSNNEFLNMDEEEIEAIFELNNAEGYIDEYYDLKKTQFTRNNKLTRF
jgi:hypothetical protein